MNGNEEEVDRIVATVPRETWRVPAAGFMSYFDGCRWMATVWSINHWIARHRVSAANAGALVGLARKDDDMIDQMAEHVRVWESSLVALAGVIDRLILAGDWAISGKSGGAD